MGARRVQVWLTAFGGSHDAALAIIGAVIHFVEIVVAAAVVAAVAAYGFGNAVGRASFSFAIRSEITVARAGTFVVL